MATPLTYVLVGKVFTLQTLPVSDLDEQFGNAVVTETVTLSEVQQCDICGEDLSGTPCVHHERRTKIDIVFEKVVEHVDAEVKHCPSCDATVKGRFPSICTGTGVKS